MAGMIIDLTTPVSWQEQQFEPLPFHRLQRASSSEYHLRVRKSLDHNMANTNEPQKRRKTANYSSSQPSKRLRREGTSSPRPQAFTGKYIFKLLVGPIHEFDMTMAEDEPCFSALEFPWA
ncbi:expressed unknown protein [Seminavis robusta]|uniref:Uncharacterized protein n=1 Tax=Seminavis robusta TaxID=568900 RepID=A0A9N8HHR2_9STRA|nr:expressed unknown protein [Seminavis robusta]|eukprot:Sro578_g169780.1 n/a (120) ;mRNA; r:13538-13897